LSHFEPLRVRPERCLAADWWLPGHCPAHDARCLSVAKTRHVGADLGEDVLCGAFSDAGDRDQQRDGAHAERDKLLLVSVREAVDLLIKEVQVREDRADQQRVQTVKAPLQRVLERGELLAQPAPGEVGEHVGIGGARDERVEHRAARDTEDVRRDAVKLDAGVLQRLVQPVGLTLALGDLRRAIPRQRSQRPDGLGRHEAALQQPGLGELAQPLRIAHIGLAARHVLDVPRVAQRQLEVVFEDVPVGSDRGALPPFRVGAFPRSAHRIG